MYWAEFTTIALAHLFAVASPGPDFAVVTRQCITFGTRAGIWTSAGVGSGILLHVSYCLLGVAFLLANSPTLFGFVKWIAACYMIFLAVQSFRASFAISAPVADLAQVPQMDPYRAFLLGFLTNGLNPKATLFFLALFTVVIDFTTPVSVQVAYGLYLALATFVWFAMLAKVLGRPEVREFMLRAGPWFERGMGVILVALAGQLLLFG